MLRRLSVWANIVCTKGIHMSISSAPVMSASSLDEIGPARDAMGTKRSIPTAMRAAIVKNGCLSLRWSPTNFTVRN